MLKHLRKPWILRLRQSWKEVPTLLVFFNIYYRVSDISHEKLAISENFLFIQVSIQISLFWLFRNLAFYDWRYKDKYLYFAFSKTKRTRRYICCHFIILESVIRDSSNIQYVTLPIFNSCNPPFLHLLSQQPHFFNDCFHHPYFIGTILKILSTAFSARLISTIGNFTWKKFRYENKYFE